MSEPPETAMLQVLNPIHDIPATKSKKESHGTKPTLANAQNADLGSSNDGSTKNIKGLLDDDENLSRNESDYSMAFSSIDPFSKSIKGKEKVKEESVDMTFTTSDARSRSSTSASTNDKVYEAAILRHNSKQSTSRYETTLTTPAATASRLAQSTWDMQAPSLDRGLKAAAASLLDWLITVGMNSMANASKQSRDAIARAQQLAQQFAKDEEDDYDDGCNAYNDDDY